MVVSVVMVLPKILQQIADRVVDAKKRKAQKAVDAAQHTEEITLLAQLEELQEPLTSKLGDLMATVQLLHETVFDLCRDAKDGRAVNAMKEAVTKKAATSLTDMLTALATLLERSTLREKSGRPIMKLLTPQMSASLDKWDSVATKLKAIITPR